MFLAIRELAQTTESDEGIRQGASALTSGRRCEAAGGRHVRIEMHFLPDVYVPVRFARDNAITGKPLRLLLREKYQPGADMSVQEALIFPPSRGAKKIADPADVGRLYAGQPATTLPAAKPSGSNL